MAFLPQIMGTKDIMKDILVTVPIGERQPQREFAEAGKNSSLAPGSTPPLPHIPPTSPPHSQVNCTWGLTERSRFYASQSFGAPSLKADELSPANPLHECWNRHATNTSEVRLASVTPSTLNPTCEGWNHDLFMCSAPRQPRRARASFYN